MNPVEILLSDMSRFLVDLANLWNHDFRLEMASDSTPFERSLL